MQHPSKEITGLICSLPLVHIEGKGGDCDWREGYEKARRGLESLEDGRRGVWRVGRLRSLDVHGPCRS